MINLDFLKLANLPSTIIDGVKEAVNRLIVDPVEKLKLENEIKSIEINAQKELTIAKLELEKMDLDNEAKVAVSINEVNKNDAIGNELQRNWRPSLIKDLTIMLKITFYTGLVSIVIGYIAKNTLGWDAPPDLFGYAFSILTVLGTFAGVYGVGRSLEKLKGVSK